MSVHLFFKIMDWGWRDGSASKSIYCSSRGSRFTSQHTHDSLLPSVNSVPGDTIPSSDPHRHIHICGARKLIQAHTKQMVDRQADV